MHISWIMVFVLHASSIFYILFHIIRKNKDLQNDSRRPQQILYHTLLCICDLFFRPAMIPDLISYTDDWDFFTELISKHYWQLTSPANRRKIENLYIGRTRVMCSSGESSHKSSTAMPIRQRRLKCGGSTTQYLVPREQ